MAASASAQTGARTATTVEAVAAAPVFFHGKNVAVHRDVEPAGQLMRLTGTVKPVFVFFRESPNVPRDAEVRGEFWDMGRLDRTDSRFAQINFDTILEALPNRAWPAREQVFLLTN